MSPNQSILVNPDFIQQHQNDPNLVILDATMPVVGADPSLVAGKKVIANALRFDIDADFSDNSRFPHTLLPEAVFTEKAQALGINSDSQIVVYDDLGIFSSPRAWWMFKAMGHNNVYILNGGLNAWLAAGLPIEQKYRCNEIVGDFQAVQQPGYFCSIDDVKEAVTQNIVILDARNTDRFNSRVDEPRPNLRRGNIPSSKNLPFQLLVNEQGYLPKQQLEKHFNQFDLDKEQYIIFSCGSGITACIDAVAAKVCGYEKACVYDGSWCEWGTTIKA